MAKSAKKKISVFLNERTIPKAKKAAKQAGVSMTEFVSEAVEQRLDPKRAETTRDV